MGLDVPFNAPFFTGAALSSDVPGARPIAIGGHAYMIDPRKYSRRTLPSVAQQSDQSSEPGEQALNREGFWLRSQSRFGLGAGQEFFDDDDGGGVRRRFWESKGLNVWEDRSVSLLPDTERKLTSANSNLHLLAAGGYLYVADGSTVKHTTNPTPTSPTFTSVTALGTVASIASDGQYVYVAVPGSTLQRSTLGSGTLSNFGATTPSRVWIANGRIVAAQGAVIFELDSAGAKVGGVDIHSDYRSGAEWVTVTGSPTAIFAGLNVGNTGEIYAITADDRSTALQPPIWAAGLPAGESIRNMTFYGGLILLATSVGLRVATVQNNALIYGPAIEIPNGTSALEPQAEFCWFGWSNYDGTSTGLGRADLSTNTSESSLVPAYASDLMAATQGSVVSAATFGGRRYFSVGGSGLWGETGTIVTAGTFESGWVRYGTLVDKIVSSVWLAHEPMPAGGSIVVVVVYSDGTEDAAGVSSSAGAFRSSLFDAQGRGTAFKIRLTLNRASTTEGPVLRSWTINALPVPARVTEIIVPIILASKFRDLKQNERTMDPLSEFQYLDGLRQASTLIAYQEGDVATLARVESVVIPEAEVHHWADSHRRGGTPERLWFDRVTCFARLLTKED